MVWFSLYYREESKSFSSSKASEGIVHWQTDYSLFSVSWSSLQPRKEKDRNSWKTLTSVALLLACGVCDGRKRPMASLWQFPTKQIVLLSFSVVLPFLFLSARPLQVSDIPCSFYTACFTSSCPTRLWPYSTALQSSLVIPKTSSLDKPLALWCLLSVSSSSYIRLDIVQVNYMCHWMISITCAIDW